MAVKRGTMRRPRLCMFDTAIATDNLGDHIIMDAVWDVVHSIFGPDMDSERIATHQYMPKDAYGKLSKFDLGIVGGGCGFAMRSISRTSSCSVSDGSSIRAPSTFFRRCCSSPSCRSAGCTPSATSTRCIKWPTR
jgi:hypothetical protein